MVDNLHPVRLRLQLNAQSQNGLALEASVTNEPPVHIDLSVSTAPPIRAGL